MSGKATTQPSESSVVATFTWLIDRDVRAHVWPGAIVGLILAVAFMGLVYKGMHPKSR
jgi:hypothetical protein